MQPPRNLIATLCDLRQYTDDCAHRITYRLYETSEGFEIAYRHTRRYCPPWAKPAERIPETTKMTRACSMEFSRMVDAVRRTPIPPIPNCGMMDIASVSLSVGCYQAAAKYSWNLGNPPHGWEILDQFAEAIFKEVHTDAKWA